MLLDFGYLYKFITFHFFFFFAKSRKKKVIDLKTASWPKLCNILSWFLLETLSLGLVDQQINLVSSYLFQ